jgi:hypothetical protein
MYRSPLIRPYLAESNDVVVDLWIGSSEIRGQLSTNASMLSPLTADAPTPLTVSRIWDRWMDATYRQAGWPTPEDYSWDLTPVADGVTAASVTPAYAQGLYYQQRKPVKAVFNLSTTVYHHTVLFGVASSAVNDNTATVATKLAHWSPLVTGVGELVDLSADFGALEFYKSAYLVPALANLQAAGKRVNIGALYVSISGDATTTYSAEDAEGWASHMGMIRRDLETALGFVGIPTVILGVCAADTTVADEQDAVRAAQRAYVAANPGTTIFFDTRPYPTIDTVHFDGQAILDIGADCTAARYSSGMGLARITKAL